MDVLGDITNRTATVQTVQYDKISIMKLALVLSCLVAAALAEPGTMAKSESEPGCTLCMDVLGDITNWITGEEQEAVVIEVLEQVCSLLGFLVPSQPPLADDCRLFMEENLPAIIEGIINDNFNPADLCNGIGICP